jgi:hypothetical protein
MKTRAAWQAEQEHLLAFYDEVCEELSRIPGVVEVGIGLRRRAGSLVEEAVYVVAVHEKRPAAALPRGHLVPTQIHGIPTDVVVHREPTLLLGFGDENHRKNYTTKVGGIAINADGTASVGTLGCFCTENSSNTTVMLSCHHVLFADEAKVSSGVGQPLFDALCCCTCNQMGKMLKGDRNLDCAIASVDGNVPFFPKIRRIKKADGTVEEEGLIKGTADPVMGQVVYKVGQRTGLTRGKISLITPRVEIETSAAFIRFADHGDSGSVVIEKATSNVVALLYGITDEAGKTGAAKKISAVLAVLNIKVLVSDPNAVYTVRPEMEDEEGEPFAVPRASPFDAIVERLHQFDEGRDILAVVERHADECRGLVQARRGFTVAWHRNHGPAWLAAIGRSSREPIYRLPDELRGVTRAMAIQEIIGALRLEASPPLRADIDAVIAPFGSALSTARTVEEWCADLEGERSRT